MASERTLIGVSAKLAGISHSKPKATTPEVSTETRPVVTVSAIALLTYVCSGVNPVRNRLFFTVDVLGGDPVVATQYFLEAIHCGAAKASTPSR